MSLISKKKSWSLQARKVSIYGSVLLLSLMLVSCATTPQPPQTVTVTRTVYHTPLLPETLKQPCRLLDDVEGDTVTIQQVVERAIDLQEALCECASKYSAILFIHKLDGRNCND